MANWSNPTLTSLYTDFLAELKARDEDLAKQFDGQTVSNLVTGAIRWSSSANRWQKWSGSAWGELTTTYALTGLSTTGNASIGGTLSVTGTTALAAATATTPATGDNSTAVATTAYVRAQGYVSGASPALTGTPTAPTAALNTNTTQIATTAFVIGQGADTTPLMAGTAAVGTSLEFARGDHVHPTDTSRAPLASPSFTGTIGLAGTAVQQWSASNTDIDGLIGGSTFGSLLEGVANGHFTVGIRSNDTGDGFQVISREAGNATYTLKCFEVLANGNASVAGTLTAGTFSGSLAGNAATATQLATPRTINGVPFDGSADISITSGALTNPLTAGSFLTSTGTYDGSVARTFAVDATSANTASKVVARDASGNFSAGTITANLTGTASGNLPLTGGGTLTGNITFAAENAAAGEGGQFYLAKPSTGSLAGNVVVDINNNSFRIFENGGSYRGLSVDLTGCGSQSVLLHSNNYNSYSLPLTGGTLSGALLAAAGSISAPGIATSGDTNTGLWWESADRLVVVAGGARAAYFDAANQFNYGNIFITTADDTAADATTTTRTSGASYLRGKYWNGTASVNTDWNTIYVPTDTAGNGEWRLRNGGTNRLVVNNSGTVTATLFSGSGASLTSLNASNLSSGTLPDARLSGTYTGVSIDGNAGTATTLQTARTINGVSFNGSANISVNTVNSLTFNNGGAGGASGSTFNGGGALTVSYNTVGAPSTTGTNASGTWGISITGSSASCTGNAATVTNGVYTTGNQSIAGVKTFTDGLNVFDDQVDGTITTAVKLGRSSSQYVTFYGQSGGNRMLSVSTAGVPKDLEIRVTDTSTTGVFGFSRAGTLTATTFSGSGASLTSLNASSLSSGTVPSARLSGSYGIDITGNAGSATLVNVIQDASTTGTFYVPIINSNAAGNQQLRVNTAALNALLFDKATSTLNCSISGGTGAAVTFNNGGAGAASGTTFNGNASRTVSYNTIGAPSTTGTNASGTWSISVTGNAGTVTNGVYTTGNQTVGGEKQFTSLIYTGSTSLAASTTTARWVLNTTGEAWFARSDSAANVVTVQRNNAGNTVRFIVGTTGVGQINCTTSATAYNTSSDYRLKENLTPLTGALDRLKLIPVHRFNFIVEPGRVVDGFLAHEVQEFVPEAVTGEKDAMEAIGTITDADGTVLEEDVPEPASLPEGQQWTETGEQPDYQGIDQAKLVPLLTAAVQELLARIEALESA